MRSIAWRFPRLSLRKSERAVANGAAGPFVADSGERSRGWFATDRVEKGDCVAFAAAQDAFSAKTVTGSTLHGHVREALHGYEALREAQPRVFEELELALLLWMERRGPLMGYTSKWSEWAQSLPDCSRGNAAFLHPSHVEEMQAVQDIHDIDTRTDTKSRLKEQLRVRNQLFDVFASSVGEDLEEVLRVIEEHSSWGRGDPERQQLPFSELLLEEYSLVMSRALPVEFHADVQQDLGHDFKTQVGSLAIFPGIDFFNHSPEPNALVVLTANPQLGLGVQTLRNVEPDEELTINYGKVCQQPLFSIVRHGFVDAPTTSPESHPFRSSLPF